MENKIDTVTDIDKDLVFEETLKYFDGEEMPTKVWINKYRQFGEITPQDRFKTIAKEFAETQAETFCNQIKKLTGKDIENLSDNGKIKFKKLIETYNKGGQESVAFELRNHYETLFGKFEHSIGGGSVLQGVGADNYSSLSNCFVMGQPYDSYVGIIEKENEVINSMKRRGGCIEENTKVIIKDKGIIPIKDVKIGDYILSFNIETGKDEWKLIKDWYYTNVELEDQILLTYENGSKLETSAKHPILSITNEGYKFINYLSGKLNHSTNKSPNKYNNLFEYNKFDESLVEIGWLIGAHIGDGSCDSNYRIRFNKSDKDVVETYANRLNKITGSTTSVVEELKYEVNSWRYISTKKSNKEFIEKYFDNQIGDKTLTAFTPSFIKNNNLWIPYIAGLIDTDGFCLNSGRLELTLSNKNIIQDIAEWLSMNGEYFSVLYKQDNRSETFNDCYIIHIHTNTRCYKDIVKYLVNNKRICDKTEFINQSNSLPLTEKEQQIVFDYKASNIKKFTDIKYYNQFLANRKNLRKTQKFGISSLNLCKDVNCFMEDEYNEIISRTNIKSIEFVKEKHNYIDIIVEDNQNYYAGNFGFVNIHNCGIDVSTLRPKYAPIHNQAHHSTGPMLFVERYEHGTREVAQDARRGALMITMNILHPDSMEFITAKQEEGELSGCNMSLQIPDEFMEAVENDSEIFLRFPCDIPFENFLISTYSKEKLDEIKLGELIATSYVTNKYGANSELKQGFLRKVKAKEYWDRLIHCAWYMAEPGLMFKDNHENYAPDSVYPQYKGVTTNPCFGGETMLLTTDGYIPFEDLFLVDNFDIKLFGTYYKAFVSQANVDDIYELIFEDYNPEYPIYVTKNHKFKKFGSIGNTDGDDFEIQDLIGEKILCGIEIIEDNNTIRKFIYATLKELKFYKKDITYNFTVLNGPNYGIVSGLVCSNCGEIRMQPYDSCRLIAENMLKCVEHPFTKDAYFNIQKWYNSCYEQQISADTLVDLESKYVQKIIDKIKNSEDPEEYKQIELSLWNKIKDTCLSSRRTGSGFLALGDTLAALGLTYSQDTNTTSFIEEVFQTKMKAELNASIDLAIIYEPFKGWNKDNEFININNKIIGANKFYQFIDDEYPEETKRMIKFGRRNVSWSTAAPTGSQSILTQTTSGIEPLFLPFYKRRVKCIDENQRVDFIDTDGQKFTEYVVLHYQFKQWIKINHPEIDINNLNPDETQKLYEQSPWFGSCAGDIDFAARILIQKIVQKYTSHSISSTLNLPNNATKEQVANIYYNSWKLGLKGQTVYRDGCRKGVIVSTDKIEQTEDDFKDVRAPKRSIELPADYYTVYDKKKCYSILIGLMNNRPYEIFIISDITGLPEILDDNKIKGVIRKEMKDVYLFEADSYDFIIPNLQDAEHDEKELGLMLSTMLRHGVPLKFLIKTLNKTKPIAGSFTYKLIKILSKYIPNGEETGEKCPDCGAKIRYENGCKRCSNPDCGYSAC